VTIRVPYLSEETIERDAQTLVAEYAYARGVLLNPPIPIEDIIEKHLKLRLDFDDLHEVLGVPQVGPEPDIFGAIWVEKREICIDQSLDPEERPSSEGRYRFTLAHEGGGHWRLHRRYVMADATQISLFGGSSKPSVVCRSSALMQSGDSHRPADVRYWLDGTGCLPLGLGDGSCSFGGDRG
jgi:hypothetical protein